MQSEGKVRVLPAGRRSFHAHNSVGRLNGAADGQQNVLGVEVTASFHTIDG